MSSRSLTDGWSGGVFSCERLEHGRRISDYRHGRLRGLDHQWDGTLATARQAPVNQISIRAVGPENSN